MKLFSSIVLYLLVGTISAQQLKHADLESSANSKYLSYVASDGAVYRVGDKLKFGEASGQGKYLHIFAKTGGSILNVLEGADGTEFEIKTITYKNSKKLGPIIWIDTKTTQPIGVYRFVFEKALESGEVAMKGMTSEKALEQLKAAKEKLDLELITKAEYDSLKTELRKHIK